MKNGRFVCTGVLMGLILALMVSFQPMAAHPASSSSFTSARQSVSMTVRIIRARIFRRKQRKPREEISVVVVLRGSGLRPRARLRVENDVIVRVSARRRATLKNSDSLKIALNGAEGATEAEKDATTQIQSDARGMLSADIPVVMDGPGENPGTANTISETATVSDDTGHQLAKTDTTTSVTSN